MPRSARAAPGGYVYHVLNRAVARLPLLGKPADYDAFERVLYDAFARQPTRLLDYCLMDKGRTTGTFLKSDKSHPI